MRIIHGLWILSACLAFSAPAATVAVAPVDPAAMKLADEILAKMTLEEKVSLCHGNSTFYINAIPRVGINDEFAFSDGPHNVRPEVNRNSWGHIGGDKDYSTSLPPLTALTATWDPAMARLHGDVIGEEARDRGKDCMLGPGVNIMRTPLCGRNWEYMGEDPYLASALVAPLVQAIQSHDVAACVKHYALNNQELNRGSVNVEVDDRTLREIYLPAFRSAVVDGGALTVMNAYNRFRGEFCSHSDILNNQILKKEWGFNGFVVTDWGSLHDTIKGALGGTDVEMNSGANIRYFKQPLVDAVKAGQVPESVVNDKARRILYVMAKLHKIDGKGRQPGARNTPEHQAAARKIAESAIVLLKNERQVLPLDPAGIKTLLVVGGNATAKHCTGGSSAMGKPLYEVSPLEGIRKIVGEGVKVEYVPFPAVATFDPIPRECLGTVDPGAGTKGWAAEFFNNQELKGEPVARRYDAVPSFTWKGSPQPGVPATHFSVRWTADVVIPEDGVYKLGLSCDDGGRLFVDDKLVVDSWHNGALRTVGSDIALKAGRTYRFRAEYYQAGGDAAIVVGWRPPSSGKASPFTGLKAQASAADAVLIFTGTDHDLECEGGDRQEMKLPAVQDAAVAALAGANPRTVVVNLSGSPVEMPWAGQVDTLVQYWFAGQEGGNALANVLFGVVNPSGKLPFTFPTRLADSPAHASGNYNANSVTYGEGILVGYRWFDAKQIAPLFPFGHGLSYTTFSYGEPKLSTATMVGDGTLTVTIPVTNAGKRAGAETVQLYVHEVNPAVPQPPQQLKGFQKLFLQPGETKVATFILSRQDLSFWDVDSKGWKAIPGQFEIRLGSSSRDLRAKVGFELK